MQHHHEHVPSLREFTEKQASNNIGELRPGMKNVDLKAIVLHKDKAKELKNKDTLHQCFIADSTGKINCNFFGEVGESLRCGDIVYLMGAYTGVFNGHMVLYQSSKGGAYRLRDFYFEFDASPQVTPNMSEAEWTREVDQKTGKEFFKKVQGKP